MSKGTGAQAGVLLSLMLCLFPLIATAAERPERAPAGPAVERELGRRLARLDEVLELGSFPNGSPLWPARLAAALERRAAEEPGSGLLRSLAVELQRLGVDRPFAAPPESRGGPPDMPPGQARTERLERLERIREVVDLLEAKLDPPRAEQEPGRQLAGLAVSGNDACGSAAAVGTGTYTGSTSGAGNDGSASCGASASSPDVWFRFTAPAAANYTFDTFGSAFDTVLSLHDGCPPATELGCSDDTPDSTWSRLTRTMAAGEEVWVRVSGFSGLAGSYTLNIEQSRGIRGTVTRQDDGDPIAGADVEVYNNWGSWVTTATTGADGTYDTGQLDAGNYYVLIAAEGFLAEVYDDVPCPPSSYCYVFDGTPITVGPGDAVGIDAALQVGATLSGTITDAASSEPLAGWVTLYDVSGSSLFTHFTEADGVYSLSSLPAGKYYLRASASDYRSELYDDVPCVYPCSPTSGSQILLGTGATVSGLDFALDHYPAIAGTVSEDGTGAPVAYQYVELYSETGSWIDWNATASDGTYRLGTIQPGSYRVRTDADHHRDELYDDIPCPTTCDVTTGTPVATAFGGDTTGIDFALTPHGRIAGTVTAHDTGVPIAGLQLSAYSASGTYYGLTTTASDGTYTTLGLPDGSYFVRTESITWDNEVYDDVLCGASCDPTTGTPIAVSADTVTGGIDFALRPMGKITGKATYAPTGAPLSNVRIDLYDSSGWYLSGLYTNSAGTYTFAAVPTDTYFLRTATSQYLDEVYANVICGDFCDATTGTPVAVTSDATTAGIDFALDRLGFVEGSVEVAGLSHYFDGYLELYDAGGNLQWSLSQFGDGTFRFDGLAPGTYRLATRGYPFAWWPFQDELFADVPCDPSCDLSLGTPLTVALNGGVVGVDFLLAACPADSYLTLAGVQIHSSYFAEACEAVTAQDVTVSSGSTTTFRAGRRIVLGDGFMVESGASFTAVIEPEWTED